MGLRVLGVGLGVFLIAFIWFVALVLSLFFHRIRTIFTLAFTGAAAVLSAILLAIPLDYRGITPQTDSLTTETPQVTFQFFNNSTIFFLFRLFIIRSLTRGSLCGSAYLFWSEPVLQ